jgi:hypothetical protein
LLSSDQVKLLWSGRMGAMGIMGTVRGLAIDSRVY